MSARPHARGLARSATTRLAVAGAAGLATLVAIAPGALAEDETPAPEPTPEPTVEVVPETAAPTPPAPEAAADEAQPAPVETAGPGDEEGDEDVEPYFGEQKYRVGVQLADGSYVPAGTTTAGTVFEVTETYDDGSTYTFTCTTSTETATEDGATFCLEDEADFPDDELPPAERVVDPGVEVVPEDDGIPDGQGFFLSAGTTVSVALVSTPPNLRGVATPGAVQPCNATFPGIPICFTAIGTIQTSSVVFSLVGLPPVATDDAARTRVNQAVDIALLPNDDTWMGAPLESTVLASQPSNGTAALNGTVARYTPKQGFTGTDSFTYTITTPNGTATATVRVVVEGSVGGVLPNTGGPEVGLLGLATLLVGAGGWALAHGRRASRVRASA